MDSPRPILELHCWANEMCAARKRKAQWVQEDGPFQISANSNTKQRLIPQTILQQIHTAIQSSEPVNQIHVATPSSSDNDLNTKPAQHVPSPVHENSGQDLKVTATTQHVPSPVQENSGQDLKVTVTTAVTTDVGTSRSDPMNTLGADIMTLVMVLLDARSLARCGSASKEWKTVAHSDDLWATKISSSAGSGERCATLWAGKRHIPARALVPGLSKLAAYSISVHESKRCSITVDDLCEHQWEFRFKDTVPQYWLDLDPSSHGEPAMQRYFHRDGSQTAAPDDPVWGGHESSFTIVEDSEMERFVRINHWPRMSISRTPDWGWELHNRFYVYTSMTLASSHHILKA